MEVVTNDDRRLRVWALGEPDVEGGSRLVRCIDDDGNEVEITIDAVDRFLGSIVLLPVAYIKNQLKPQK